MLNESWNWAQRFIVLSMLTVATLGTLVISTGQEKLLGPSREDLAYRAPRVAWVDLKRNHNHRGRRELNETAIWRDAAATLGFQFETLRELDPNQLELQTFDVFVMAQQEFVSEEQWSSIELLLERGNSFIFTGRTAIRNHRGERYPAPLMQRVLPVRAFNEIRKPGDTLRVTLRGPIVAGLDPGAMIDVTPERRTLVADAVSPVRWIERDDPLAEGRAALVDARYADARVIWTSFTADIIRDESQATQLLGNLLQHAAGRPILELRAWPSGFSSAAIFSARPDSDPQTVNQLDRTLLRYGALLSADHGADYEVDRGLTGLAPEISADPNRARVRIPRPLVEPDRPRAADLLRDRIRDFKTVASMGGLYHVDADLKAEDVHPSRVLDSLLGELKHEHLWFTDTPALSAWWDTRAEIEVDLGHDPVTGSTLAVTNHSPRIASGVTIRIYLPYDARHPSMIQSSFLHDKPSLRVGSDRSWIDLIMPDLKPSDSVEYRFKL